MNRLQPSIPQRLLDGETSRFAPALIEPVRTPIRLGAPNELRYQFTQHLEVALRCLRPGSFLLGQLEESLPFLLLVFPQDPLSDPLHDAGKLLNQIHGQRPVGVRREHSDQLSFHDHRVPCEEILLSPGRLKRHYSPKATLRIISWKDDQDLQTQAHTTGIPFHNIHLLAYDKIPRCPIFGRVAVIPEDPEAYARALYSELHRCDREGARLILVEAVPGSSAWRGIQDRLARAAAQE